MTPDQLIKWKNELESQLADLRSKSQEVAADIQKKTHQLNLVQKLIASTNSSVESILPPAAEDVSVVIEQSGNGNAPSATSAQVKDNVFQILSDAKRPMNINEIHAEFQRRGYAIPGKGTPFNILVHISREAKT